MSDFDEMTAGELEAWADALRDLLDHSPTTTLVQVSHRAGRERDLKAIEAELAEREAAHAKWTRRRPRHVPGRLNLIEF